MRKIDILFIFLLIYTIRTPQIYSKIFKLRQIPAPSYAGYAGRGHLETDVEAAVHARPAAAPARSEKFRMETLQQKFIHIQSGDAEAQQPGKDLVIPVQRIQDTSLPAPLAVGYPVVIAVLAILIAEFPVRPAVNQRGAAFQAARARMIVEHLYLHICKYGGYRAQTDWAICRFCVFRRMFLQKRKMLELQKSYAYALKEQKCVESEKPAFHAFPGCIFYFTLPQNLHCAHKMWEEYHTNYFLMEQLNRIELRGNVGNVRINSYEGKKVANIALATNIFLKGRNGEAILETTWHNIVAWEGKNIQNLEEIAKGAPLSVVGRMRNRSYLASDNSPRYEFEVLASEVRIEDEVLSTPSGC